MNKLRSFFKTTKKRTCPVCYRLQDVVVTERKTADGKTVETWSMQDCGHQKEFTTT